MRSLVVCVLTLALCACGDDDGSGTDSGMSDVGTSDTGGDDAGGDDAGDDAAGDDAGGDDAGADDAGGDDAGGVDAGTDDAGDPCDAVTIGDLCESGECGDYVCEEASGRCAPVDRPTCGGFVGEACPESGMFTECLSRTDIADGIGPCLSPEELACVCTDHSDIYFCPED